MGSFTKNKTFTDGEITLSFIDVGNSSKFLTSQICFLTLLAKIKLSRKFPNLQDLMIPLSIKSTNLKMQAKLSPKSISYFTKSKEIEQRKLRHISRQTNLILTIPVNRETDNSSIESVNKVVESHKSGT